MNCLVMIIIQDIKIVLQIGRITYILNSSIYSFISFVIVAVKAESEECEYFVEHVDIKPEVKPISLLAATMSEVRQGCEFCTSTHIQNTQDRKY